MSYFICDSCDKKHEIFQSGAGQDLADRFKIPLLGEIPLIPDVVTCGDNGVPITLSQPDSIATKAYQSLAGQVAAQISINQAKGDKKVDAGFELAWKE